MCILTSSPKWFIHSWSTTLGASVDPIRNTDQTQPYWFLEGGSKPTKVKGQSTVHFAPLPVTELLEDKPGMGFFSRICTQPPARRHTHSCGPKKSRCLYSLRTESFLTRKQQAPLLLRRSTSNRSLALTGTEFQHLCFANFTTSPPKTSVWMKSNCLPPHPLCQ